MNVLRTTYLRCFGSFRVAISFFLSLLVVGGSAAAGDNNWNV
jgi:hypothetical protein